MGIILDPILARGQVFWTPYLLPETEGKAFPASSALRRWHRAWDCSKAQKHLMEATTGWSLKGHHSDRFWFRWSSPTEKAKSGEHRYHSMEVRRDAARALAAEPGMGSGARAHCPAPGSLPLGSCPDLCLLLPAPLPALAMEAVVSLEQGASPSPPSGAAQAGMLCKTSPSPLFHSNKREIT